MLCRGAWRSICPGAETSPATSRPGGASQMRSAHGWLPVTIAAHPAATRAPRCAGSEDDTCAVGSVSGSHGRHDGPVIRCGGRSLLPARRGEGARRADEGRARCAECSKEQASGFFDGAPRVACHAQDATRVGRQSGRRIPYPTCRVPNAERRVRNATYRAPELTCRAEDPVYRVRHAAHRVDDAAHHVHDTVRRVRNSERHVLNLVHRVRNPERDLSSFVRGVHNPEHHLPSLGHRVHNLERRLPNPTCGVCYPMRRVESPVHRVANTAYRVPGAACRAATPTHQARDTTHPPRRPPRGRPEGL